MAAPIVCNIANLPGSFPLPLLAAAVRDIILGTTASIVTGGANATVSVKFPPNEAALADALCQVNRIWGMPCTISKLGTVASGPPKRPASMSFSGGTTNSPPAQPKLPVRPFAPKTPIGTSQQSAEPNSTPMPAAGGSTKLPPRPLPKTSFPKASVKLPPGARVLPWAAAPTATPDPTAPDQVTANATGSAGIQVQSPLPQPAPQPGFPVAATPPQVSPTSSPDASSDPASKRVSAPPGAIQARTGLPKTNTMRGSGSLLGGFVTASAPPSRPPRISATPPATSSTPPPGTSTPPPSSPSAADLAALQAQKDAEIAAIQKQKEEEIAAMQAQQQAQLAAMQAQKEAEHQAWVAEQQKIAYYQQLQQQVLHLQQLAAEKQAMIARAEAERARKVAELKAQLEAEKQALIARMQKAGKLKELEQMLIIRLQDEESRLKALDAPLELDFKWTDREGWSDWEDVEVLTFPVVGDPGALVLAPPEKEEARVRWRLKPFGKGTFRFAHNAQLRVAGRTDRYVIKFPIEPSRWNDYQYFVDDAESSAIAREIAIKFNEHPCAADRRTVEFIKPKVLHFTVRTDRQYAALETIIPGSFTRFTNNVSHVSADRITTVLAYGHFSWHYTKGNMMVVDLQGVRVEGGVIMTDPALHRRNAKPGHTDAGTEGMRNFFSVHKCNPICFNMGLTRHHAQPRETQDVTTIKGEF